MANTLKIFNFESQEVRTVLINGEPWFVGKDVATILGYNNPQKALRDHVDEEDKGVNEMDTPGGKQPIKIINESGLYSLIISSKLPSAKRFKHWVTSEVLPSIRETGSYSLNKASNPPVGYFTPEQLLSDPRFAVQIFTALGEEREKNQLLEMKNFELESQVEEMEPKVDVYEEFIEKGESLGIRETANLLGIRQNEFTAWLELKNFIYRKKDKSRSIRARAQYLDKEKNKKKWFDEKLVPCNDDTMRKQVFVTPQGQSAFRQMLKDLDLSKWIEEQMLKIEMEQQAKESLAQ